MKYTIDVYEEDGIFEASTFIPDAPPPYVRNPFVTATSAVEAVSKLQTMIMEIESAREDMQKEGDE